MDKIESPEQLEKVAFFSGADIKDVNSVRATFDEMINTVSTKLDSFKLHGLSEKYLSKTKEMQLNELDKKLRENEYWLDELFSAYINNSTYFGRLTKEYSEVINSINNQDIKSLSNKYFSDENLLKIILYPENK